jgi:hypothetical protein
MKYHDGTMDFSEYSPDQLETFRNPLIRRAAIGAAWEKDSSLEKWFPLTAEELAKLRTLQKLVADYMTADSGTEQCKECYENLEAWWKDQQIKQSNP